MLTRDLHILLYSMGVVSNGPGAQSGRLACRNTGPGMGYSLKFGHNMLSSLANSVPLLLRRHRYNMIILSVALSLRIPFRALFCSDVDIVTTAKKITRLSGLSLGNVKLGSGLIDDRYRRFNAPSKVSTGLLETRCPALPGAGINFERFRMYAAA